MDENLSESNIYLQKIFSPDKWAVEKKKPGCGYMRKVLKMKTYTSRPKATSKCTYVMQAA